jgi:hypothetical protein
MRLEYLPDGAPECPLIRLFDFNPVEAAALGVTIAALAAGRVERVAALELPDVAVVDGCELVLLARGWDQSIVQVGRAVFECGFTPNTWNHVAGLIEPFAAGSGGYQWLAGVPGDSSLLLSVSGLW